MSIRTDRDDFDRADGPPGSGWVIKTASWALSNERLGRDDAPASTTPGKIDRAPGFQMSPNRYVETQLAAGFNLTDVDGLGINTRELLVVDSGSIVSARYLFGWVKDGGGNQWLLKDDGGPTTSDKIVTGLSDPAIGDILRMTVDQDMLEGWRNGEKIIEQNIKAWRQRYAGISPILVRNEENQTADELFEYFEQKDLRDAVRAVPDEDVQVNGFDGTVTPNIYQNIDEDPPGSDAVRSPNLSSASDFYECRFTDVPLSRDYVLYWRGRKTLTAGAAMTIQIDAKQGTTVLASTSLNNTALNDGSDIVETSLPFTADGVVDGTDIRARLTVTAGSGTARRVNTTNLCIWAIDRKPTGPLRVVVPALRW